MKRPFPQLLVADHRGKIRAVEHLAAAGMEYDTYARLTRADLIKLPAASRLFTLPGCTPIGYDPSERRFVHLDTTPGSSRNTWHAVAAFTPPAFTITHNAAYIELAGHKRLPLFGYAAVAAYNGDYYVAAIPIDRERRHDPRRIDLTHVRKGISTVRRQFHRANRLIDHLVHCALTIGCPGAQNFFLGKYEAPLPVSPACNARCAGCISYQPSSTCPAAQDRIGFVPQPDEIAAIALFHFDRVRDPVASFGQGCEGEPLMHADTISEAIRRIRAVTKRGIINMNTNGSRPQALVRLFAAGLGSIRVSMNSAQPQYYERYYRPHGYSFTDVLASIRCAKKHGVFVSLNYLTMPGFTDSPDELAALERLVATYHVDMIQWRNLNFDPLDYFRVIRFSKRPNTIPLGIRSIIIHLRQRFPHLMMGYYNPSLNRIARAPNR